MERESFENEEIAKLLNDSFISIKVDKEERPDIDNVYMRVCQAFTGSGGWPTSVFITPDQKPFFAGTYFPKDKFANIIGMLKQNWDEERKKVIKSSDEAAELFNKNNNVYSSEEADLFKQTVELFNDSFDSEYGGFGDAPKFPSPHNLMFLLEYSKVSGDKNALNMAEKTLMQMYKGGIFDHIGNGFSRYSTDKYWLVPHFEKMLYDNALISTAYLMAYECTQKDIYKEIAQKIFIYVQRELIDDKGVFYSAQDADSDGVEGKYYVFTKNEIAAVLSEQECEKFCEYYNITDKGNFEGKNIPNLIAQNPPFENFEKSLKKLYEYRKSRIKLHLDHKILTSWNSLMIWSYVNAARIFKDNGYLIIANKAANFIIDNLLENKTLYVGMTDGKRSNAGFLDDYAFFIMAITALYEESINEDLLKLAVELTEKTIANFFDYDNGGFYFTGNENEQLIFKPKESYDGAIPSGNSVMTYNLTSLFRLTKDKKMLNILKKQIKYMRSEASSYPANHSFFLLALLSSGFIEE